MELKRLKSLYLKITQDSFLAQEIAELFQMFIENSPISMEQSLLRQDIEWTLNTVQHTLKQYFDNTIDDKKCEERLRLFLKLRWEFISNTSLDYQCAPFFITNRLCLQLAACLVKADEPICTLVLPSIQKVIGDVMGSLKESTEVDGEFLMHHFIIDESGTCLINIPEITNYACINSDYLFPEHQNYPTGVKFHLSENDRHRLAQSAGDFSVGLYAKLKYFHECKYLNASFGNRVKLLAQALHRGSVQDNGAEYQAHTVSVADAIIQFYHYWRALGGRVKRSLSRKLLQDFHTPYNIESYLLVVFNGHYQCRLSSNEIRRVRNEGILNCLHQISLALEEFLVQYPELYQIDMRTRTDFESDTNNLFGETEQEKLEQALKMRGPDDMRLLLSDRCRESYSCLTKLYDAFCDERYLSYLLKSIKTKEDLELYLYFAQQHDLKLNDNETTIQNLAKSLLSSVEDVSYLITSFEKNNYPLMKRLLKDPILTYCFQSIGKIKKLFQDLDASERDSFILNFATEIRPLIRYTKDYCFFFSALSTDGLSKFFQSHKKLFKAPYFYLLDTLILLDANKRLALLKAYKAQVKTIFKFASANVICKVLNGLNSENTQEAFSILNPAMGSLSNYHLKHYLKKFSLTHLPFFLENGGMKSIRANASSILSFITTLEERKKKILFAALKDWPDIYSKNGYTSFMKSLKADEQCEFLTCMQLEDICFNSWELQNILKPLRPTAKGMVIQRLKDSLGNILTDDSMVCVLLESFDRESKEIFIHTLMHKLHKLVPSYQIADFLSHFDIDKQALLLTQTQENLLPNTISSLRVVADIFPALKSPNLQIKLLKDFIHRTNNALLNAHNNKCFFAKILQYPLPLCEFIKSLPKAYLHKLVFENHGLMLRASRNEVVLLHLLQELSSNKRFEFLIQLEFLKRDHADIKHKRIFINSLYDSPPLTIGLLLDFDLETLPLNLKENSCLIRFKDFLNPESSFLQSSKIIFQDYVQQWHYTSICNFFSAPYGWEIRESLTQYYHDVLDFLNALLNVIPYEHIQKNAELKARFSFCAALANLDFDGLIYQHELLTIPTSQTRAVDLEVI